jgi:hypothetical protein
MAVLVGKRFLFVSDGSIVEILKYHPKTAKNKMEVYSLEFVESKTKKGLVFQMSILDIEILINFNLLQKII